MAATVINIRHAALDQAQFELLSLVVTLVAGLIGEYSLDLKCVRNHLTKLLLLAAHFRGEVITRVLETVANCLCDDRILMEGILSGGFAAVSKLDHVSWILRSSKHLSEFNWSDREQYVWDRNRYDTRLNFARTNSLGRRHAYRVRIRRCDSSSADICRV